MTDKNYAVANITVLKEQWFELRKRALEQQTSASAIIRQIIEEYLNKPV
jgi:hypothetical protein